MKPARKLHVVRDDEPSADIYARWKADIAAIDWSASHIRGDRAQPIELPDSRRGWYR
jgi:hypothetical protein